MSLLDIIRWILVIPAVYVGNLLFLALLMPIWIGVERISVVLRIVFTIFSYFAVSVALVLLAAWIAPSHQILVAILAAFFNVIEAWHRCSMYRYISPMAYPNAVARILGAIIAAYNM